MTLNFDPRDFSQTIGAIYQAAHDPLCWSVAIERIRLLFGGSKACIVRIGPEVTQHESIASDSAAAIRRSFPTGLFAEYLQLEPRMSAMPLGVVYSDLSIHGLDALRASRFWREWMAPQDMYGGLGCRLAAQGASSWTFDVQRGPRQVAFDAAEAELAGLLVPHLTRAIDLSRRDAAARLRTAGLDALSFGMLLVEAGGRVVSLNAEAGRLLNDARSPLRMRAGRLSAGPGPRREEALRRAIGEACPADPGRMPLPGADIVLRGSDGEGEAGEAFDLLVSVAPLGAADGEPAAFERLAVVALRRVGPGSGPAIERPLRSGYGLSPKEAWLVGRLADGRSLQEAAAEGGIALSTVRSYLEAAFAKTGTHRQGELVALARTIEPLLARRPG